MKNYIKGTYYRTIFSSDSGYIIGLFKVKETNDPDMMDFINESITFTGYFHELTIDEKYILYGNLVDNFKYGLQYNVKEYERVMPEEKDAIIEFLSGDIFKGVGEKTARQIVDTLGDETLSLIEDNYQNLLLVPNMKEDKAKKIHETLTKYNESYNIILELNKIGFSIKDAMKIYNRYKDITMTVINDNLYNLMYDLPEISFNKLEQIRYNLKIDDFDKRRIEAIIIYTMKNLCFNSGNTYLFYEEIKLGVNTFLEKEIDIELFDEILNNLQLNSQIIKEDDEKYFLRDYYMCENEIADTIYYLVNKKDINYKDFEIEIDALEYHFDVKYNDKQKEAIKNALFKNFSIITGSPGTGKTTIVQAIVELYRKKNGYSYDELSKHLVLLAPTGRASKKLSESCLYPASTIHRFLKWNKEDNSFMINERNKSNVDFVIVDEVSMIDTNLLNSLLKGLSKNVKIVFIGDYNQLESVSPGKILKDLIDSDMINVTYLTEIYRQKDNSYISQLAKEINDNELSEYFLEKKDDYSFIQTNDIKDKVKAVAIKAIEKGYNPDDIQVLCPMYKGENGIDNLNRILQEIFNPDNGQNYISHKDIIYRENDKILLLENDIDNNVFNGDIGYISKIDKNNVFIDFDGTVVKYTPKDFDKIKHGYAISIHKAQGSEFKIVILPICYQYRIMLYKKLIYTAVTRAKDNLTIIGDPKAFYFAVNNSYEIERKTNLLDRLISLMNNY